MKKMMILGLLFVTSATFAQTFQLGIKGGGNLSSFTGGNDSKYVAGYHFGGFLNFKFGNVFSVQPEVLYTSQGAKFNGAGGDYTLRVGYIAVPVMAKLKFNTVYLEAGPQLSFKTNEDGSIPNQPINNFAKNLDLSLGAGIGYHSKSGFGIGARYLAGLTKVGNFDSNEVNPDFKNNVVQLSAFFTLLNNK